MKPELFNSLKGYKKKDLFSDLIAGLMVAIIALPLSIALGIQSVPETVGLNGIQAGIITAIIAGFFISAIGGSRFQIGGPTAAFVVILFGYLSNPEIGVLGLAIAGIMAGVILMLMGLLKCGSVMKFFPYPITIGFTTGIGITLIVGQIKDLLGLDATGSEVIHKITSYIENIGTFDLATFGVGLVGLACVILLPKVSKKIPSAFVALIVCTGLTLLLNANGAKIDTIGSKYGEIEAGFFPVDFSSFTSINLGALIVPAIVIAFLCAIESLLSATVASGMTDTGFNPNQELFGQGVANIFSSLFGGLPATGAIARTAASIENGAKSSLAGVFHAIFVMLLYFLLMGVVKFIPLAVFSAILMSVAINMSRFKLFGKLSTIGVFDSIVLFATCILTVIFDLTYGVLGGVALTFIINIKNIKIGAKIDVVDAKIPTVVVKGALLFVNANKFADKVEKLLVEKKGVIVDFASLKSIDQTALEKLSNLYKKAKSIGGNLDVINSSEQIQQKINKFLMVVKSDKH